MNNEQLILLLKRSAMEQRKVVVNIFEVGLNELLQYLIRRELAENLIHVRGWKTREVARDGGCH